jgi:aryl-alcohol dehydrogenase-like predicted oxidoreductase
MEYRRLGKSGLRVSAVGLGTNNFGMRLDEKATAEVVHAAIDQGITMVDTSNSYGRGLSEEYIGKAIKGQREKVVLATKFASPLGEGPREPDASRKHMMEQVAKSLQRLGTDYIDLYQVHFPDPGTPIEETLRGLDDLLHQGKVRYIGCSNFSAWQACEAVWTSRSLGLNSFISVQPLYNLLARGIEGELLPFCQAYNIGIIPYFPLSSGLLTGKYRPGQPPPQGTRLAAAGPMGQRMLTQQNLETVVKLEEFAQQQGHSILELAFGWLLSKPQVATVIAGATSPDQVKANVAAGGAWRLTTEEMRQADDLTKAFVRA